MQIKEVVSIILAVIILSFVTTLFLRSISPSIFFYLCLMFLIIISVNLIAKHAAAKHYMIKIETKIWQLHRYWFYEYAHFKKPLPFGIILPVFFAIFSFGAVPWLAVLQTNFFPLKTRSVRRFQILQSYSQLTDFHIAVIASFGIIANLILAIAMLFTPYPLLAKLSAAYAFYNMLPLGQLDGTKILFGSGHIPGTENFFATILPWLLLFSASFVILVVSLFF